MGFREKDGEEFDQVKVALVPVVELHVPNEFGLDGHVVVSEHAAVPPVAELHSDESSDEMAREGRGYLGPFLPHGSEGLAVVGDGGESLYSLSPSEHCRGKNLREDISTESPRTSPLVHRGLGQKWARRTLGARGTAAAGPRAADRGALRVTRFVRQWVWGRPVGWGRGEGSGRSWGR
jgi:hypothetical protein